ncbi:MAG: hypothetical protein JSU68_00240, partial [Phycisphaerales bacterium]
YHGVGLKADGSIVSWGHNSYGQCDVPVPNTDFVALAAGNTHGLGIRSYARGDLDHDRDVDLADFATFALCYHGASVTVAPPGCSASEFTESDFDDDGDVDLADFATFAQNYTGAQ